MKPFVDSGCVKSVVLWNPIDLGYAAMYVMRAVVDGTFKPGDTSVEAGRLGDLQVVNGSEVLLGAPFIYTLTTSTTSTSSPLVRRSDPPAGTWQCRNGGAPDGRPALCTRLGKCPHPAPPDEWPWT